MNRFLASLVFRSDTSKSKSIGDLALLLCKDKHACALCMCFARLVVMTNKKQVVVWRCYLHFVRTNTRYVSSWAVSNVFRQLLKILQ